MELSDSKNLKRKNKTLLSKTRSRKFKKNIRKHGLFVANAALILVVTGFVLAGQNSGQASSSGTFSLLNSQESQEVDAPLDGLSSAGIAANIAMAASIPQVVTVVNQADSYEAQLVNAETEEAVIAKPQVISGAAASKSDIISYTSQEGDTLSTLANKFGITSDTIKWSNDLSGEFITAGTTLKIPPSNGVIYKVGSSDTVDAIASTYSADKAKLVAFNDIELTGIKADDIIFIPEGQQPAAPVYTASTSSTSSGSSSSSATYGYVARYGGNSYTRGYCTWYAASRIGVPNNWGNANTWDNYARSSGWTVSSVPVVGAVAQTDRMSWWGHVAVVEEISQDGTQIRYSDMNGVAGYGRVGYSGWVSTSTYEHYIYR